MFSRRHPYLFFLLIMAAMFTVGIIFLSTMAKSLSRKDSAIRGEKVGVIEIAGAIADSKTIIDQIKTFRDADAVKAIVLRIDSPGGGVGASQEIYREIQRTVAEKHVVASMGAVAASGGYYVAAACDGIVANPGTITGSIGVIMGYTNFEELLRKIGLSPVVIKSGAYKDLGSPMRPMTAEEEVLLQALIGNIHRQFVAAIAEGRGMETDRVDAIADGRLFTGEEAIDLGLVDRLGNLEDAITWAGELGGIEGEVETVYPEQDRM
ncbi:MAG: signal peptide peptidase SppA, partial [Desulfatitalea sp.]|nr:signal peptide peptidase SppA [Desulfatitalea sp.]